MSRLIKNLRLVGVVSRDVSLTALKEKMLYGFLLLALLFILMANVPFMIDDPKVFGGEAPAVAAIQIGFVSINVFTILIAIFVSVGTLQNFLNEERLLFLLSKPVRRWQILEGVVLGLFKTLFMNWFLMTSGLWLVLISQTRMLHLYVWTGTAVTVLMALLYVSLVVFFYTLIPNTMAGIISVFVIIAGFGVQLAEHAFEVTAFPAFMKWALGIGLKLLPQINALWGVSMQKLALFDLKINAAPVILQTITLIIVLNLVSCWRFRRFCRF